MADTTDWDSLEEEFGGDFKPYADYGEYEVKLDNVTLKEFDGGGAIFEFNFEQDEYQYPKATRSFFRDEKVKFRKFHYCRLMMVLGATKEAAHKAIDTCEKGKNRSAIADAYKQTFNRLAAKHPTVKIEVRPQLKNGATVNNPKTGKPYSESEFADPTVHFSNGGGKVKEAAKEEMPTEIPEGEIDLSEIPF